MEYVGVGRWVLLVGQSKKSIFYIELSLWISSTPSHPTINDIVEHPVPKLPSARFDCRRRRMSELLYCWGDIGVE